MTKKETIGLETLWTVDDDEHGNVSWDGWPYAHGNLRKL